MLVDNTGFVADKGQIDRHLPITYHLRTVPSALPHRWSEWRKVYAQRIMQTDSTQRNEDRPTASSGAKIGDEAVAAIGDLFMDLGFDCKRNIDILVQRSCELMGGVASLYNRYDEGNKSLVVCSGFHLPPDMPRVDDADGHICHDVTMHSSDQTVVLNNLDQSDFAESDPSVRKYGLKAYVGHPVLLQGKALGALAVVYAENVEISDRDVAVMRMLARALSLEEERRAAILNLNRSQRLYATTRNIAHAIVHMRDHQPLIERICYLLADTVNYSAAWILLWDEDGQVTHSAQAGRSSSIDDIKQSVAGGALPPCIKQVRSTERVVPVSEMATHCERCALKQPCMGHGAVSAGLWHQGRCHGMLTVLASDQYVANAEEHDLLGEVAADIAYALSVIEVNEQLKQRNELLAERDQLQKTLLDMSQDLMQAKPSRISHAVMTVLVRAGQVLGADRVYMLRRDERASDRAKYEWCSTGVTSGMSYWTDDAYQALEALLKGHDSKLPLVMSAEESAAICDRPDKARFTAVPMRKEGEIFGVLVVDDLTTRSPRDSVQLDFLRIVSQIIQATLARFAAEAAVRRLIAGIEQSGETIVITDETGAINYVNPAFTELTGYTSAEVIGQNPRIVKSGQQSAEVYEDLWRTLKAGERWQGRLTNRTKAGQEYTVESSISPVRNAAGQITNYVAVQRDITAEIQELAHREGLEQQLLQAQKMEAVGHLAGGIAHDYNNSLQIILGYAELATKRLPEGHPALMDLAEITKASKYAADLTRQMLGFARRQMIVPRVLDLNKLVVDMRNMLRSMLGETIDVRVEGADRPAEVYMDPSQIQQILMNLAANSRDAMPQGGVFSIKIDHSEIDEEACSIYPNTEAGSCVQLTIADTGSGIEQDEIDRIFEPFYTTKAKTKGTGLGLANVYGIVNQNKGIITVKSVIGEGTQFDLYFPVSTRYATVIPADQEPAGEVETGHETILVVDDERSIVKTMQQYLQGQGYKVLTAYSGEEALDLSNQYEGQIDLLITDCVMTGMSGPELAKSLVKKRPNLQCIFMSGYSMDRIELANTGVPNPSLLPKPFALSAVGEKLREQLTGKAPAQV